jgi:hypothetical protein
MDFTPQFFVGLAQFAWLLVLTITTWLRKPGTDAMQAISLLQLAISKQDALNAQAIADLASSDRLMDERVKHLPTHNDMRALIEDVSEVKGSIGSVRDAQSRQQRVLERIEDWLNSQSRPHN